MSLLKTGGLALLLGWQALVMAKPAGVAVFVSIPPQAWLLERIGGERLQIRTMLGPNANPHNYDPVPRQLVGLADADLYFTIGIPFETMWQARLAAANPQMQFVHCGGERQHDHDHDHAGNDHQDPHVWTSPLAASAIAECMHDALVRHDPDGRHVYNSNLENLQSGLTELHEHIRQQLADINPRYMLVQHPAWGYFAETYDLAQLAIEKDGHEPNARHLVDIIERGRELGLHTVFVQRQYSPAAARLVADAIDGRIIEADPMARDYMTTLRHLAQSLVER